MSRADDEYNQRLSERLQVTQRQLEQLAEAYAEPDLLREQVARLEEQVRQLGGEPWQPEAPDSE